MTRQDDMLLSTAVDRVDAPDEETAAKAQRAAAFYAKDADDLAELLAMLGLGAEPLRPKRIRKKSTFKYLCVCGRPMARGDSLCGMCRKRVPVELVREVVDRIAVKTGWKQAVIARHAGITPECLSAALKPSDQPRRTATENLERLKALAAEVGA